MKLNGIPQGVASVLAVSAHPDDTEVFAGGTLASLINAGARGTLVVCTDGGRGGRGLTDAAGTREDEQTAAAREIGFDSVLRLGCPDGDLEPNAELRDRLIAIIRDKRPDIVFAHHPQTFYTRYGSRVQPGHSDHRASGSAVMDAIYPRAGSPNFLPGEGEPFMPREVWLFDCSEPDHLVEVTETFETKIRALRAHDSQQGAGGGLIKAAHRLGALFGSDEQPAEAFVRLRLR